MLAAWLLGGFLFGDLCGEELPGFLELVFAGLREAFAGAVDVKVQHAHARGGAFGGDLFLGERAMMAADLLKRPSSGWVESVVTFADHFLGVVFFEDFLVALVAAFLVVTG